MRAVGQDRALRIVLGEMVRESETHAGGSSKFGAVAARAEQPDRRQRDIRRHGMYVAERMAFGKAAAFQQNQFLEAFEKFVAFARVLPAAQRVRGDRIGPGRAAEAEIDA